jgi:hypothetical protein
MPKVPEPMYGTVTITQHADPLTHDYGLTIDRADPLVLISAELLRLIANHERSAPLTVIDDRLTIRGRDRVVTYRLTGWDGGNRIGELVVDDTPSVGLDRE